LTVANGNILVFQLRAVLRRSQIS